MRCDTCGSHACDLAWCDEHDNIETIIQFCKTAPSFDDVVEKFKGVETSQLWLCWKATEVLCE